MRQFTWRPVVLSLLVIGLTVALQPTILAMAKRIGFTGDADLQTTLTNPEPFFDDGGGFHLRNGVLQGHFDLDSDDGTVDIVGGTITVEFSGDGQLEANGTFTGVIYGFVQILEEDQTVAFDGNLSGSTVNSITTGKGVGHGSGNFEGMTLKISFEEVNETDLTTPTDSSFFLTDGVIINPKGD